MTNWPIYYKDVLFQANPKTNVGICTLWTPKDVICSKLDPNSFSLGGQLYSKRGVNFILRNILANPIINTIILCGADRSKSGEAFLKFMRNGIDDEYKVKGDDTCEIQKEIDKTAIADFRKKVKIIDKRGIIEPKAVDNEIIKIPKSSKPWAKPKTFAETEFKGSDKFPSEKSTFNVRASFIWEAWVQILRLVMKFGSEKGMIKIGQIKELVNVIATIEDENPYNPKLDEKIFNFNKKDLKLYYDNFFKPEKGSESYNYGERLFAYPMGIPIHPYNAEENQKLYKQFTIDNEKFPPKADPPLAETIKEGLNQLEEIYEKYKRYHDDRGMVCALWNPWTDNVKNGWMSNQTASPHPHPRPHTSSGNVPCMALLQFTYRSKKLHLTAYFRSNDMFDAWPRNAFALRKLQYDFAKRIGKKAGYLTTISNCAQVYETNYEAADRIIKKYEDRTFCRPDPRSTLIIETKGKEIVVRHMAPDGNEQLDEFRINGTELKAALKLMDKLNINNVFSDKYQVADIAIELTKAEWCVKNNKPFIQDKDWKELIQ